jgi:virginiamycin A acetyltransferase
MVGDGRLAPLGWDLRRPRAVAAAERVAYLLVAPLFLAHRLKLVSFLTAAQIVSRVPGALGLLIRRAWYGATLAHCGKRLRVMAGTVLADPSTRIADDCHFGMYNHVGLAFIGSHFMSGPHVAIVSGRHGHEFTARDVPIRYQPRTPPGGTSIGEDVWVGANATVAADVAAHTVVGAGAVVTKTFAEWNVIAGNPARVIRERP